MFTHRLSIPACLLCTIFAICACALEAEAATDISTYAYVSGAGGGFFSLRDSVTPIGSVEFGAPVWRWYTEAVPTGYEFVNLQAKTPPRPHSPFSVNAYLHKDDPRYGDFINGFVEFSNASIDSPLPHIYYSLIPYRDFDETVPLSDFNWRSGIDAWYEGSVTLNKLSAQDVLPNVLLRPVPKVDGNKISFDFSPTVKVGGADMPVTLDIAAKLMGFDRFDWVQHVTHLPSNWTPKMLFGAEYDASVKLFAYDSVGTANVPLLDPVRERDSVFFYAVTVPESAGLLGLVV